jgi:hypothetical protein
MVESAIMTEEEKQVWQVLATCRGRAMAILGPEIADLTGLGYKRVQKIVSDLVCHHAKPIGSGTCGYYIPVTAQEDEDAAYYLRHRAIVALYRAARRQATSLEAVYHQAVLEFSEGAA